MTLPTRSQPPLFTTIHPFEGTLIAQTSDQKPVPVQPQIDFEQIIAIASQLSGFSVPLILIGVVLWRKIGEPMKDKYITPNLTNLTNSYKVSQKIRDRVQSLRSKTDSHRALLFETDKGLGSISLICQELSDGGIAPIDLAYKNKESECVKHISDRFIDNDFICREVNLIERPIYRGYLHESGVYFVIYHKVLTIKDRTWILALHYRYEGHVSYIAAQGLRDEIKEQCDSIASLLQQNTLVSRGGK